MKINDIPIVGVAPGSQPEQQGDQLNFMPMPKTFDAYRRSKWLEPDEVAHMPGALEGLASLQRVLENHNPGDLAEKVDLSHLTPDELAFVDETLGEGEVSIVYDGPLIEGETEEEMADYVRSMRRLLDLPVRVVHGGHFPSYDGTRHREMIEAWLREKGA